MQELQPKERILVALDTPNLARASGIIEHCREEVGGFKVGLEFFNAQGPQGVRALPPMRRMFLDLKLHDIPNTVAGAMRSAVTCRPTMITVHAAGGRAVMRAAKLAAEEASVDLGVERPLVLAVTVLTSLDEADLAELSHGTDMSLSNYVLRLAALAQSEGLDGVICSPAEIARLRRTCGEDFLLVVPGIRPEHTDLGDQKRIATPALAVSRGADYLVIGRPITEAVSPARACRDIAREIAEAFATSPA